MVVLGNYYGHFKQLLVLASKNQETLVENNYFVVFKQSLWLLLATTGAGKQTKNPGF